MAHPVWHWRPRRAGKIDLLPAQGVAHLGEVEGRHRRKLSCVFIQSCFPHCASGQHFARNGVKCFVSPPVASCRRVFGGVDVTLFESCGRWSFRVNRPHSGCGPEPRARVDYPPARARGCDAVGCRGGGFPRAAVPCRARRRRNRPIDAQSLT